MSEVNGDKECRKILGGFDIELLVLFAALSFHFLHLQYWVSWPSLKVSGCIFEGIAMIMFGGVISIVRRGRDDENCS